MSYIRMAHVLKYVDGESDDYVFPTTYKGKDYIEDYGKISDSGFIELLFREWDTKDKLFKQHLLERLAKRLNVKLRKKPLTTNQWIKEDMKLMDKFTKRNDIKKLLKGMKKANGTFKQNVVTPK